MGYPQPHTVYQEEGHVAQGREYVESEDKRNNQFVIYFHLHICATDHDSYSD